MATNRTKKLLGTLLVLGSTLFSTALFGQPPEKKEVSNFTYGGDLRLRNEYVNSASTLSDSIAFGEQDYFRYRLRVWAAEQFTPSTGLYLRIAAEPRTWIREASSKTFSGKGMEWKYALADALYLKWTGKAAGNPVTLTIGRQDIQIGDTGAWWLIAEGTPVDGSWTWFFDAARLNIDFKDAKTKLDIIFLQNQALPDQNLPILGRMGNYSLTEQRENGVILYATNNADEHIQIDTYFIYKGDRRVLATGNSADIYTGGMKLAVKANEHLSASVEGAYQWGRKSDTSVKNPVKFPGTRDLSAFGAVAKLGYAFKDSLNNQLGFEAELLSGDKAKSQSTDEMFDILWGRYPRYSEVYVFSYAPETGRTGLISNLMRVGPTWSFSPCKGTTVATKCNFLFADEEVATRASNAALFSGTSHNRGTELQVTLRHQFNKQITGLLLGEVVQQGDFYTSNDTLAFARCELNLSF